jgi:glycosyltransferase involved in cell wall biosynthesis
MRVAIISQHHPDYAIEFAEMMSGSCHVLLCIPNKYRVLKRPRPCPRLEVAWLNWPRQRSLRNIAFIQTASRRIRDWKPDIVHFLFENNVWNVPLAFFLRPTPVVTTVHDITFHPGDISSRRVPRVFANILIRMSGAIIVHGEWLRAEAQRRLPISPARIFVTPLIPALLPSEFPQQSYRGKLNDRFFRVLFFGRIFEYKGLRYLIKCIPLVREKIPNVRLVIAGQGDQFSQYASMIDDISAVEIRNRFIPPPEVAQLFFEADVLALPYIEASNSGPLMIALAFGVPVVATDVGELPSVVRSASIGLVIPPRDERALAAAIIKIATDNNLHERFSQNAKKAMDGDYSQREISAKVLRVYKSVLDSLNRKTANP